MKKALTDAFNERFGCNRTVPGIRLAANNILYIKRSERQLFTAEEDAWLVENYPKYKSEILVEMFTSKFNHKTSARNIIGHCNRYLKIKSGRKDYKKGESPYNFVPIGTERRTKQGYVIVKVNDKKSVKGDSETYHENWKFKHVLVWERYNGKVPDGNMIVFLDSDKENFDISNLVCIPKKIASIMARNKWYTDSPEHTMTAIKWCELHFSIKNFEEEGAENG